MGKKIKSIIANAVGKKNQKKVRCLTATFQSYVGVEEKTRREGQKPLPFTAKG